MHVHVCTHRCKVQLFGECHKIFRNLPYGVDIYKVNVITIRQIAQIFVAFSEKLNFTAVLRKWPFFNVDKILAFWAPNPSVDIFYLLRVDNFYLVKVDNKLTFLYFLSTSLCQRRMASKVGGIRTREFWKLNTQRISI